MTAPHFTVTITRTTDSFRDVMRWTLANSLIGCGAAHTSPYRRQEPIPFTKNAHTEVYVWLVGNTALCAQCVHFLEGIWVMCPFPDPTLDPLDNTPSELACGQKVAPSSIKPFHTHAGYPSLHNRFRHLEEKPVDPKLAKFMPRGGKL